MLLQHIVAAADESDAGRQAARTAVELASLCSARVTILRVVAVEAVPRFAGVAEGTGMIAGPMSPDDCPEVDRLRRWLEADVLNGETEWVELGVAYGIPGIEICRFAEDRKADLVVLGRKRHSQMVRLLLGDTADAVARRSRFPCLFVPPGSGNPQKVLVTLDGSDRGISVLNQACDFARCTGADIQVVTVERQPADDPVSVIPSIPGARSSLLQVRVREVLTREGLPDTPLAIRQGDIVEQILRVARETESDMIVVGYHRGGPPGILEAGSTARRLAHAAPCAVLTIPL
jgi:nucleotide-binding universal stress UspA family protein